MRFLHFPVFALTVASFLFPSVAQSDDDGATCDQVYQIAEIAMKGRQGGVPMREMIERAEGHPLFLLLTETAYDEPRFRALSNQRDAVSRYADEWYRVCYKARKSEK